MPIPFKRDLSEARASLQRWFERHLGTAAGVRLDGDLDSPSGAGNANETFLFSITYGRGEHCYHEELVLRIQATAFSLFMDASLAQEVELIGALRGHMSTPVAEVRWFEPNPSIFGAPFCIMTRTQGQIPPDDPGAGWVVELPVDARRRLWRNAFATLCRIHTDPRREQVEAVLSSRLRGRSGVEEQLDYWKMYRSWSRANDPQLDQLFERILACVPKRITTGLSWGDARMQNMIFDADLECAAVIDWEMANLGGPLMDLAWWLIFDRFLPITSGSPWADGHGTRDETLAAWEELTHIPTSDLAWYEAFALYRLGSICARTIALNRSFGVDLSGSNLIGAIASIADGVPL